MRSRPSRRRQVHVLALGGLEGSASPDERPPEKWTTGDDPATERQVTVLEDHGVKILAEGTKARASQLITAHVHGGARA